MLHTTTSIQGTIRIVAAGLALIAACLSPALSEAASDARHPLAVHDSCSWNRPGIDPFMGDVVAAVDRYTDIPADVRARLKDRMAKREYDDLVSIRRDRIEGDHGQQYNSAIRDMHFGAGQVCRTVTRDAWTASMQERGLVYCESGQCILVPTVCRNVSRIARRGVAPEHAQAPDDAFAALAPAALAPAALPPAAAAAAAPDTAGVAAGPGAVLASGGASSFGAPAPWDTNAPRAFARAAAGESVGSSAGASLASTAAPASLPSSSAPLAPSGPWIARASASVPNDSGSLPMTVAAAVPEPATWASLLAGLVGVAVLKRRRRVNR